MSNWKNMELGKAIQFNPPEKIAKNSFAKKIAMEQLIPFNKKICGYEIASYSCGPKFKNGDTLLAKITPCLENGKTAQVDILDENEVAFGSSEFIVLRENELTINDYIFYLAKSPAFRKKAIGCMEGTSGRKRVVESALKLQVLPFPDKPYQHKISSVLSALDAKIELNNRINAELESMAKTLYDYWFVQFDFPDKNGKPYKSSNGKMVWNAELKREIPVDWEVKSLSAITDVSNDQLNPMDTPDKEFKHYSIPAFDACGSYKIEKGSDILSNKFVVKETDLLVSKLNPWFSRVIYATDESDLISSTEFVVWRSVDFATKNYMYMIARDASFITYCSQSASGTSNSHKRVNPTVMMKYRIVYNKQIAESFGRILGSTIKMYAKNQIETNNLAELRDWLLPMLMNGQVKVS